MKSISNSEGCTDRAWAVCKASRSSGVAIGATTRIWRAAAGVAGGGARCGAGGASAAAADGGAAKAPRRAGSTLETTQVRQPSDIRHYPKPNDSPLIFVPDLILIFSSNSISGSFHLKLKPCIVFSRPATR